MIANNWEFPKRAVKSNNNLNNQTKPITLQNRFSSLPNVSAPVKNNQTKTFSHVNNTRNKTAQQQPRKKKVVVFSDSMTKRINRREFNQHTEGHSTYFNCFPGATTKSLKYYVQPTLADETNDLAIVHVGTNDIAPRPNMQKLSNEAVAEGIIEIGKRCVTSGVKDVVISGLIVREDREIDERRVQVNNLLRDLCLQNGFKFLDNGNIPQSSLWKDGLHLTKPGIVALANNMIYFLNNSLG